jgi:hypothetical protein
MNSSHYARIMGSAGFLQHLTHHRKMASLRKEQNDPRHGEINDQNQANAKGILGRICTICGVHIKLMSACIC